MTSRGVRTPKWYRSITVKLALTLGLAMFSIQLLASILIVERFQAGFEESVDATRLASSPYAKYLSEHLTPDDDGQWIPTAEDLRVVETFLQPGETYLWLDSDDSVLAAGQAMRKYTTIGQKWSLCDSPEYCEVTLEDGDVHAGSTWTPLGVAGRQIGTFVLIWFESPMLSALEQNRLRDEMLTRLTAAGLLATLTSLLLVRLVTRRLSRLASEASSPVDASEENVALPGPFEVRGEDEISQLAVALNTMRSRIDDLMGSLAERDRQRREWIAQVSHDLRTPLTALTACLDRARSKLGKLDIPEEQRTLKEAIMVARQDADRVQTLVDGLFELARLDAGESLILEPVPPGELVRQAVRGLGPMAENQGVMLRAIVEPSLPTVQADGRRLMRALENLIRNAIHFAKTHVDVRVVCESNSLRFEVSDNGPGLPEEDGRIVLEQPDDQPRRPDSAGLGLIVTRRVAAAHGGKLGGHNLDTGGACVWISIPVVISQETQV